MLKFFAALLLIILYNYFSSTKFSLYLNKFLETLAKPFFSYNKYFLNNVFSLNGFKFIKVCSPLRRTKLWTACVLLLLRIILFYKSFYKNFNYGKSKNFGRFSGICCFIFVWYTNTYEYVCKNMCIKMSEEVSSVLSPNCTNSVKYL